MSSESGRGSLIQRKIKSSYLAGPDAALYSVVLPNNATTPPTIALTLVPTAMPSPLGETSPPISNPPSNSLLSLTPTKGPSTDGGSYQAGFIFTNSYSSSTCTGAVLFSFGDYLGYCIAGSSSSTKYFINPESCGTILKMTYESTNCSGTDVTNEYVAIANFNSTTDYMMGSTSCDNGILANCSVTRPFPVPDPFVMGQIYYDTCNSELQGYVQSATNVCFNSNSGTANPYEFVLQSSNEDYFTTYYYSNLSTCTQDFSRTLFASNESLAEQSCIA
mmetsp:Transcript_16387/g.22584  ORF Transcript_16387/g.22584 Transcript_16387/m.22584 type:complete len:276 (+) Transcript_16387:366-1193(+)|eukprot:CAMPEP_0170061380 /NCGR_PEP_ID=MMETSP0019_2-20121128/2960_1 /TAXON_ID=98059 /ORGANISM="Dinobryon sp., Strain UTEXLB2267" /LENGTH=275 /DNA_ID=CAMNT_0010267177 /DNA_START=213 /DNA_END=1040 /DNA_ORIENTATION=-